MKRKVLHLISQSHLDPVWLWPIRDGVSSLLTTVQSAVDRAHENPDFAYSRSSLAMYRWLEDTDPRLFEQVKDLVKQGRWEILGGWEVQPDCNLPGTESFFRQALYAKTYCAETFGTQAVSRIGYVPDSFGHSGGLPQILSQTGFEAYAFMRPAITENPDIPLLFTWRSKDGSEVLGIKIGIQYSQSYAATADDIEKLIHLGAEQCFAEGFLNGALWFGTGNHGGGPTKKHIERIRVLQRDTSLPEIRFSTLAEFVAEVKTEPAYEQLPVIDHELGYIFRGCYSATSEVKADNRKAEKGLYTAEALAIMAGHGRLEQPSLDAAWRKVLFNHFHDIMAGTCTKGPQRETRNRYGAALDSVRDSVLKSTASIARRVNTEGESNILFVANPLPWARTVAVGFDTFTHPHELEEITHLENQDGTRKYPIQWLKSDSNFGPWGMQWGNLCAVVDVPACGYATYRIAAREVEHQVDATKLITDPANQFVLAHTESTMGSVELCSEQPLTSLRTKRGVQLLSSPVKTVVIKDPGGTWGHGIDAYSEVLGLPEVFETEILERGELQKTTRQKSRWGKSVIWMDVVEWAHTEMVELRLRINWQEERAMLKLQVPLAFESKHITVKMPAESISRPADGHEYACHDWLLVRGKEISLGLINDSRYSYDFDGSTLRMILARSVPMAEHPPFDYKDTRNVSFLDQGWLETGFLLCPSDGQIGDPDMERLAMEFQIEPQIVPDSGHEGSLPWTDSLLTVEPVNVSMLSLKTPLNGDGVILRLQEIGGKDTIARCRYQTHEFSVSIRAWQIVSLHIQDGLAHQIDALETSGLSEG